MELDPPAKTEPTEEEALKDKLRLAHKGLEWALGCPFPDKEQRVREQQDRVRALQARLQGLSPLTQRLSQAQKRLDQATKDQQDRWQKVEQLRVEHDAARVEAEKATQARMEAERDLANIKMEGVAEDHGSLEELLHTMVAQLPGHVVARAVQRVLGPGAPSPQVVPPPAEAASAAPAAGKGKGGETPPGSPAADGGTLSAPAAADAGGEPPLPADPSAAARARTRSPPGGGRPLAEAPQFAGEGGAA